MCWDMFCGPEYGLYWWLSRVTLRETWALLLLDEAVCRHSLWPLLFSPTAFSLSSCLQGLSTTWREGTEVPTAVVGWPVRLQFHQASLYATWRSAVRCLHIKEWRLLGEVTALSLCNVPLYSWSFFFWRRKIFSSALYYLLDKVYFPRDCFDLSLLC